MKHLATLELPASALRKYPGNARKGSLDEIQASLRRNGQYRSIVVRADNADDPEAGGVILAGNNTFAAATQHEGWQHVRCEVIECDDAEAKRIVLVDNKLNDKAKYDDDALAELVGEAALDGLDGTGFTDAELQKLLGGNLPAEGDADSDELENVYGVTVECDTEPQQAELLEMLSTEGWRVRALMR